MRKVFRKTNNEELFMEKILEFITTNNVIMWIIGAFALISHVANLLIGFFDGLETVLKNAGKAYSWVDKVTNVLAFIAKWTSIVLNFVNANKKVKKK